MAFYRAAIGGGSSAQVKTGSFNYNGTNTVTINCGFKPKQVSIYGDTLNVCNLYDENISTTNYILGVSSSSGNNFSRPAIGSGSYPLTAISNTGFSCKGNRASSTQKMWYVAVG